MDPQMIRLFLAIAAHKNISRAADSLFLSQSTASRRLAELEKELGVELFNRSKGQDRLYMTPQGHEFLAIATAMDKLYENALSLKDQKARTSFYITAIDSFSNYVLTPFLNDCIVRHPELRYCISFNHSKEIIRNLSVNQADIGISNSPAPISSLESSLLFEEEFLIVHKNPALGKTVPLEQLDPEHEIYQHFDDNFNDWHNKVRPLNRSKVIVNNTRLWVHLFSGPEDWGFAPRSIANIIREQGFYVSVPAVQIPLRKVWLITRKDLPLFIREIASEFSRDLKDYLDQNVLEKKNGPL